MDNTERQAAKYLKRYEKEDRRARRLHNEYIKELELIDAVRSTADIDGLPKGKSINKETEERAIRLADKAAEIKIASLDAIHERLEIGEIIFQVKDDDQQDVLMERYVNYTQTWEQICVKLNMSWGTVHNKHKAGLRAVYEILQTQNLV